MSNPHEQHATAPEHATTVRELAPEQDPNARDRAGGRWLSVDEVAALEGVKARTVQKRAASGKYNARRVPSESGGDKWEIEASAIIAAHEAREQHANAGESDATAHELAHERARPDANQDATVREQAIDYREKYIEQLEIENRHLRGDNEQHQRAEAELRAALREALRAMPKQLGQGTPPSVVAENATTETPVKRGFWDWLMGRK